MLEIIEITLLEKNNQTITPTRHIKIYGGSIYTKDVNLYTYISMNGKKSSDE